ncbi:CsbD family protein [Streptomyces sp. NPDC054842]
MSENQKAEAKTEQAKGKAKEAVGRVTGNERLTAEGKADQTKGDARQAKEKAKDAFRH